MKIGLLGFYWPRNFGDDLMALAIADFLRPRAEVQIFGLDHALAEKHGHRAARDLALLVRESDFLVFGGGNLLAEDHTWPAKDIFDRFLRELIDALRRHPRPIVFISVGGNGQRNARTLLPAAAELLRSPSNVGTTVRLVTDLDILRDLGVGQVEHHPDILFQVGSTLSPATGPAIPLAYHLPRDDFFHFVALALHKGLFPKRRGAIQGLVALNSFPHESGDYLPRFRNHDQLIPSEDPAVFASTLKSIHSVVSHKLHVGLMCLLGGGRFLSLNAHPKVGAQLEALGLRGNIIRIRLPAPSGDVRIQALFAAWRVKAALRFCSPAPAGRLRELAGRAEGHFQLLARTLDEDRARGRAHFNA